MVYFLYGDTAPLQIKYEELLNKIKNDNLNIPEKIFDASLDEISMFFDSVSTNSIFSPKELVILKRAETLKNLEEIAKSLKIYNLTQKEIIIVYEEFLNDFGKAKNPINKKTVEKFKEIADVLCFRKENERKSTIFYLQKELNISEYEAEKLIELIGDDFFKLKNEVEKIKNFLDGDIFNLEKVKNIVSTTEEFNLKNLIENFLLNKNPNNLLYFLQKEKLYTSFLYSISEELILYLKLLAYIQEGIINKNISYKKFNDEVYDKIKNSFITEKGYSHPYTIFLKLKNIDLFSINFITKRLEKLMFLEYNIKSGSLDMDIGVEAYILDFFM